MGKNAGFTNQWCNSIDLPYIFKTKNNVYGCDNLYEDMIHLRC